MLKAVMNMMNSTEYEFLKKDMHRRFLKFKENSTYRKLKYYYQKPQYRTLLYYRLNKIFISTILRKLFRCLYEKNSKKSGLEILTHRIGGGIIMPHWGRIILNAEQIGDNLYVFHNVTIGDDYMTGRPTIGDNVFIGTASTILGNVTIGDNVVIGAGSCVLNDIPSNSLAGGNPARVIKSIEPHYIQEMIGY
jgi:serine O-acetyltransferase